MATTPPPSTKGAPVLMIMGAVIVLIILGFVFGGGKTFTRGEHQTVVVGADSSADQSQTADAEIVPISAPVVPPEANRFINATPVPVNMPATGLSERFPVNRGQTTCPSEYPEEFGYRTICHARGAPDNETTVFDEDDRDSCQNTDWIAYESTNGQAKTMDLNFVRYPERCPA